MTLKQQKQDILGLLSIERLFFSSSFSPLLCLFCFHFSVYLEMAFVKRAFIYMVCEDSTPHCRLVSQACVSSYCC